MWMPPRSGAGKANAGCVVAYRSCVDSIHACWWDAVSATRRNLPRFTRRPCWSEWSRSWQRRRANESCGPAAATSYRESRVGLPQPEAPALIASRSPSVVNGRVVNGRVIQQNESQYAFDSDRYEYDVETDRQRQPTSRQRRTKQTSRNPRGRRYGISAETRPDNVTGSESAGKRRSSQRPTRCRANQTSVALRRSRR